MRWCALHGALGGGRCDRPRGPVSLCLCVSVSLWWKSLLAMPRAPPVRGLVVSESWTGEIVHECDCLRPTTDPAVGRYGRTVRMPGRGTRRRATTLYAAVRGGRPWGWRGPARTVQSAVVAERGVGGCARTLYAATRVGRVGMAWVPARTVQSAVVAEHGVGGCATTLYAATRGGRVGMAWRRADGAAGGGGRARNGGGAQRPYTRLRGSAGPGWRGSPRSGRLVMVAERGNGRVRDDPIRGRAGRLGRDGLGPHGRDGW